MSSQSTEEVAKPTLRCRLFGHRFYWLDVERRHHCSRCGVTDRRFVERTRLMREVCSAGGCDCAECEAALSIPPGEE